MFDSHRGPCKCCFIVSRWALEDVCFAPVLSFLSQLVGYTVEGVIVGVCLLAQQVGHYFNCAFTNEGVRIKTTKTNSTLKVDLQ